MSLNVDEILSAVRLANAGALTRAGAKVRDLAKEKAPVRKVFKAQVGVERVTLKSIEEITADVEVRKILGLGSEFDAISRGTPPTIVTRPAPQMLQQRKLPVDLATLSPRGRSELKSGRAIYKGQLGGRLRGEIFSTPATIEGNRIEAHIVSPTPYAKYQEFGTAHNPAHPYLRPALHQNIDNVKADVSRSTADAIRRTFSGRINITLRLG